MSSLTAWIITVGGALTACLIALAVTAVVENPPRIPRALDRVREWLTRQHQALRVHLRR